jgi:hypothetical protein
MTWASFTAGFITASAMWGLLLAASWIARARKIEDPMEAETGDYPHVGRG